MYAQGSYNSDSRQAAPAAGMPPYQQLPLPPPPPPSHNFQQNNQAALHPGQPGMPLLQRGPQFPLLQQPYLHASPGARGSFMPPRMHNPSQLNLQQNYRLAPGILASHPAPPAVSNSLDVMDVPLTAKGLFPAPSKGLLPNPSPGKMMHAAPVHQLPLQKPGVLQVPQNISAHPRLPQSVSSGNFQMPSVAPLPLSSSLSKPAEANTVRKIDDDSSVQDCIASGYNSPSDSDMEVEGQNNTCGMVSNVFDVKGQLPASQNSADSHTPLVALPDVITSGSSVSGNQGTSGRVTSELRSQVTSSAEAAECPAAMKNMDITNKTSGHDVSQGTHESFPDARSQVIESSNLSKHNQNNVSDKTSGHDANLGLKEACSQLKSSLVVGCAESLIKNSETSSGSESAHKAKKDLAEEPELIVSQGTHESFPDAQRVVKEAVSTSITSGSTGSSDKDHVSGCATPPKDFPKENAFGGELVHVASSGKSLKEKNGETAVSSNAQRIDKYGRLVRDGAITDSDSDDSRHVRRNRRRKSCNRSRSPVDRRRRSPRRRRANRSRSRSWSPIYRRSRSRSPSFRHAGKFSRGSMRRDNSQLSDCFDFRRGKCYRGASCRYLHHDSGKIDGFKRNRDKPHIPSKNPNTRDNSKKFSSHDISQQMKLSNNVPVGKAIESDQPLVADTPTPIEDATAPKVQVESSQNPVPYLEDSVIQQSQPGKSNPVVEDSFHAMQQTNDSFVSDSSLGKVSSIFLKNLPVSETIPTSASSVHNSSHPALTSGLSTTSTTQPSRDYKLNGEVAVQSHTLPFQNSGFSMPPNNASSLISSLPPYNSGTTTHTVPMQFQQIPFPPNNNLLLRPYSTRLPVSSQVVTSQHQAYPQMQLKFSQAQNYHQPATFSGNSVPSGDTSHSSSRFHQHLQQQGSAIGLHHVRPDDVYGSTGIYSSCGYTMDDLNLNQPARSAQYNSYEQPLGSKLSSDVLRQEKDKACSGKDDHSLNGGFGCVGSVNSTMGTGKNVPRSGGDEYDPLLDSIEQLPNSSMNSDHIQKWEPSKDSDKIPRDECRDFNKPLDVEENNQIEESSVGVGFTTCADNEEIGLTADAEVGNVENFSHGDDNEIDNVDDGEMEIDAVKSSGKTRKSKEARSMKLFKVALADFVKDVLKPSWRQGNMSKEAFKTVVRKTVDKVSEAMKSHHIPKSKAKIEQYINSSQRKLTKLVMGYVDKYAKG